MQPRVVQPTPWGIPRLLSGCALILVAVSSFTANPTSSRFTERLIWKVKTKGRVLLPFTHFMGLCVRDAGKPHLFTRETKSYCLIFYKGRGISCNWDMASLSCMVFRNFRSSENHGADVPLVPTMICISNQRMFASQSVEGEQTCFARLLRGEWAPMVGCQHSARCRGHWVGLWEKFMLTWSCFTWPCCTSELKILSDWPSSFWLVQSFSFQLFEISWPSTHGRSSCKCRSHG